MNPNLSGRQFHQLPMFATPTEIVASHALGDERFHHATEPLGTKKLREAKDPGRYGASTLHDQIRREGVSRPLSISHEPIFTRDWPGNEGKPMVNDGHHRLFSALDSRPHDLIPLEHNDYELAERLRSMSSVPRKTKTYGPSLSG